LVGERFVALDRDIAGTVPAAFSTSARIFKPLKTKGKYAFHGYFSFRLVPFSRAKRRAVADTFQRACSTGRDTFVDTNQGDILNLRRSFVSESKCSGKLCWSRRMADAECAKSSVVCG
jgi:hypothetical protein